MDSKTDKPFDELKSEYLKRLGVPAPYVRDTGQSFEQLKAALSRAETIRDFEIGMYWTRSNYFWGFQVAVSAAVAFFFQAGGASSGSNGSAGLPVAVIGIGAISFLISHVWVRMLTGAKFWQDNWERHIDILEDFVYGPIYKTYFVKTEDIGADRNHLPVSVTKSNLLIAQIFRLVWFIVTVTAIYNWWASSKPWGIAPDVFLFSLLVLFLYLSGRLVANFIESNIKMANYGGDKTNIVNSKYQMVFRSLYDIQGVDASRRNWPKELIKIFGLL